MARPAIRCFSTDLPPLGCDIVSQPVAPPIADMLIDSGCNTCSSLTHHARRFDLAPSGPCDCHVQDIACLGCGNVVGYYIHRPCFRCLAQRLRIKQRGFQHLWTFYQDNVFAVQRENEFGELVGWEELPVPPAPTATAIRSSQSSQSISTQTTTRQAMRSQSEASLAAIQESIIIESSNGAGYSRAIADVTREYGSSSMGAARIAGIQSPPTLTPPPLQSDIPPMNERTLAIVASASASADSVSASAAAAATADAQSFNTQSSNAPTARRAQWLMYMSQRVSAERILHNPRAGREARQEAIRTLTALREQEWNMSVRGTNAASTAATSTNDLPVVTSAQDPTPFRPSTQVVSARSNNSGPATLVLNTPSYSSASSPSSAATAARRDEVMEPLRPAKSKYANAPPPAGLSNWLFQVGLDCMVKWEEGTLSR
ncbi:Protein fam72a [Kickxella alabastrina]|uniref:Protein fam72a n=1 Tax=Kickxella alabastrina TaxID=61397 RepID=A0ACC1ISE6_9FUNG|nr:Protein fam72a [Kickxella alabastrina]